MICIFLNIYNEINVNLILHYFFDSFIVILFILYLNLIFFLSFFIFFMIFYDKFMMNFNYYNEFNKMNCMV